jgi:DNA-binding transcriptional LysR family regulator
MKYNLQSLLCFKSLAETKSFTQTAKNLKLTQPGVSRSIKELENQMEVDLFNRSTKRVSLTLKGEELYQKIKTPLLEIDQALTQNRLMNSPIRIGSIYEFGEFKILPELIKLQRTHQEDSIHMIYGSNDRLVEMMRQGEIDIVIGIKPPITEDILAYKLLSQSSYLYTSVKSTLHKKVKEADLPFVGYLKMDPLVGAYFKHFYPKLSYANIKNLFTANSHASLITYLNHFPNSYGVLPQLSAPVAQALQTKKIMRVNDKALQTDLYIMCLRMIQPEDAVREWLQLLRANLKSNF